MVKMPDRNMPGGRRCQLGRRRKGDDYRGEDAQPEDDGKMKRPDRKMKR